MIFRPAFVFSNLKFVRIYEARKETFLPADAQEKRGRREDACNRITADSPENLGVSCAQFDACDRAACELARPAIDVGMKILVLTAFELEELFKCFMNGYSDGEYVKSYCQTAAPETAFGRAQKKLLELWQRKN